MGTLYIAFSISPNSTGMQTCNLQSAVLYLGKKTPMNRVVGALETTLLLFSFCHLSLNMLWWNGGIIKRDLVARLPAELAPTATLGYTSLKYGGLFPPMSRTRPSFHITPVKAAYFAYVSTFPDTTMATYVCAGASPRKHRYNPS